jgi:hypothetical protein
MAVFQHVLWGYQLTLPDGWVHASKNMVDTFAAIPEALDEEYLGPNSGQILVRCEWNPFGQPIDPIWNKQVGMMASLIGAKKVGTAPWQMGGARGLEAEIQLAQKDERRLWSGVLERQNVVLNFVVVHLKAERAAFEPIVTQILSTLAFPEELADVETDVDGLPLPPEYTPIPAQDFIADIAQPDNWRAYDGSSSIDALQAFYWREAPRYGWKVAEYLPYPGFKELGFARFRLEKGERSVMLGILPYREEPEDSLILGRIALKIA